LVEYELGNTFNVAAEAETAYLSKTEIDKLIREKRKSMEKEAKELDLMQAAKLRDEIKKLQEQADLITLADGTDFKSIRPQIKTHFYHFQKIN